MCDEHVTPYFIDSGGLWVAACFPLCEECWSELSIRARIPYYEALWLDWVKTSLSPTKNGQDWQEVGRSIREAVLAGL